MQQSTALVALSVCGSAWECSWCSDTAAALAKEQLPAGERRKANSVRNIGASTDADVTGNTGNVWKTEGSQSKHLSTVNMNTHCVLHMTIYLSFLLGRAHLPSYAVNNLGKCVRGDSNNFYLSLLKKLYSPPSSILTLQQTSNSSFKRQS